MFLSYQKSFSQLVFGVISEFVTWEHNFTSLHWNLSASVSPLTLSTHLWVSLLAGSNVEHCISVSPLIFGTSLHEYFTSLHLRVPKSSSPSTLSIHLWVSLLLIVISISLQFFSEPDGTLSHLYFSSQLVSPSTHTWVSTLSGETLYLSHCPLTFPSQYGTSMQANSSVSSSLFCGASEQ